MGNPFPTTTQNDPLDEGVLLQTCSPAIVTGQTVQTGEIVHEFLINDNGEAVSSAAVVATDIPFGNDHTYFYIQQDISQFNEESVLVDTEPANLPESDVTIRAPPSPQTEYWKHFGDLVEVVDIKLRVEEHGDCLFSPDNKYFHVKTMSKFAFTAVMTGL